ncbi:MAG TPA: hypothetical protein VFF44_03165, partial [Casimicrobiaceae bacterium]|nr:hypothetical protein [Casimicrobiaceae bacterium]
MLHRHLSRASLAVAILAPFVMCGCASLPQANAAKPLDAAAIAAAAAASAEIRDEPPGNGRGEAPGPARP